MYFRPSQWLAFLVASTVSKLRVILPALRQWAWYGFRRGLLLCSIKYAVDTFWLCFKKRKLGVSFLRELSLLNWVAPSFHYYMDPEMRVLVRKCGYHYSSAGIGFGKKVQPWFYGDIKDNTKRILERMEAKAHKLHAMDKKTQAADMQAVIRVLKGFKEFTMDEIMVFFKVSDILTMEEGQVIFGADDKEEYFYGVVEGEIHLFCHGTRGPELLKVADFEDCIVSLNAFLRAFTGSTGTYGNFDLYATCGKSGRYCRVPISEILKYASSDTLKENEIIGNILVRQHKFHMGLNDLTGILPRMHKQSYLDGNYAHINLEPGIISDTPEAEEAFSELSTFFHIERDDRKLCWVGVLDSRTILLRRYKETKYAFYIHKGLVACTVSKLRRSYNAVQFYLSEGQIMGWREAVLEIEMAVQYQVADGAKALVIAIPGFLIRKYSETRPQIVVSLIKKLTDRQSALNQQVAYTLRFTHRRENEAVYRRPDATSDSQPETYAYLCLSGRLRFLYDIESYINQDSNSQKTQYGIIETGEWFGLVGFYADNPQILRTVICDRCAEFVTVPRYVLTYITNKFREAAGYQCDYLARLHHRDHEHTFLDTDKMGDTRFQVNSFGAHTWRTYRMICIYPASEDIPARIYCDELARHHTSAATVLTREDALAHLKVEELNRDVEFALAKWLVRVEEKTTMLFLLADNNSKDLWNETIAKLCDMVQVLVTYEVPHNPNDKEQHILEMASKARKEIVFIHPVLRVTKPQVGPGSFPHLPQGSVLWLRPRQWVQRHHHVRMIDSAFKYVKNKDPADWAKYLRDTKDPDKHSDFARVMRWISGQSVGIVLGGGGAKGAAHLGALRYLHELDVPVDYLAGVSMGSFVGALYALHENIYVVETKARELWEELKNPSRYLRDLQFHPFSAMFRGHSINWIIRYFFENAQIEDLYIPYFCVTSDLHDNCSRTHMSGDLWFYVRASMTLTLVFPPQINQFDYHLLMDGGYSDLVPAMTMRRLGIKYLVAINIGDERLMKTFNIGYHVSGVKCLLQSLLPYSIDSIPNHFDIWDALLYCSARNFIQILKAMDEYCVYIRPNIDAYTGLDFQSYEEIKTLGYISAKCKFGGLRLKNLPVHVLWYLLRFYTYPNIASSQSQLLQGFTDEDWEFAVNLMSKTQMFLRARTTFLKMNLTPYLTDLMEARSYLEEILKQEEVKNINLHVPVLENFSRDDERLDLVHAIARMKEWTYMEDFESILEKGHKEKPDLKIKTKVHAASSQTQDLLNAKSRQEFFETHFTPDIAAGYETVKGNYSLKDLYQADPVMFQAVASYYQLGRIRRGRDEGVDDDLTNKKGEAVARNSELAYHVSRADNHGRPLRVGNGPSLPSLHSIITGFGKKGKLESEGRPTKRGQRLEEYRKCLTSVERKRNSMENRPEKMTQILTLKELRRSFGTKTIPEAEEE